MSTYFHSWRRKLGVVMLVVASLFAGGWVRSLSYEDRLVTYAYPHVKHDPGGRRFIRAGWVISHRGELERITSIAVGRGGKPMPGTGSRQWTFPYWSIVIPLTLLSAWLLLGKPRKANRKAPS